MNILKKALKKFGVTPEKNFEESLYSLLSKMDFGKNEYRTSDMGEGFSVIEQSIWGWWKQRYLIDNNRCRAYEIMDGNMCFVNFTTEDIDRESIEQLPEKARNARCHYPLNFLLLYVDSIMVLPKLLGN